MATQIMGSFLKTGSPMNLDECFLVKGENNLKMINNNISTLLASNMSWTNVFSSSFTPQNG